MRRAPGARWNSAGPVRCRPYATVLDEMTSTGYAGTELGGWGFMPTEPEALSGELARRQLALTGAFVPVQLTVESGTRSRCRGCDPRRAPARRHGRQQRAHRLVGRHRARPQANGDRGTRDSRGWA